MAAKDMSSSSSHSVHGDNTVIGPSILISGKLTGDEDLTVRGRVEGELSLTKTLMVEPSGVVKANVAVRNAIISGVVVGNINATESVELTKECRMVGDIHAPRVIIVEGASFRGRIDMGEVEPGRVPAGTPKARPVMRSAPPKPPPPPAKGEKGKEAKGKEAKAPPPPPPPPKAEAKASGGGPQAPVVAAGAKKKVIVKKKGR
jgi:cytoskeletal protein CcmA (bactofilin family)